MLAGYAGACFGILSLIILLISTRTNTRTRGTWAAVAGCELLATMCWMYYAHTLRLAPTYLYAVVSLIIMPWIIAPLPDE